MSTGILHTHTLVVVLFLILYTIKVILLLMNHPSLESLRAKTKVADMILGTLILATGIGLMVVTKNTEGYILTKLVLVLACIPAGIVAMKKSIKWLAVLVLLVFIYVLAVAYADSVTLSPKKIEIPASTDTSSTENKNIVDGKAVYDATCVTCHGPDGKLQLAGAKDLSITTLSTTEIKDQVLNGKNAMPSYNGKLSEEEIDAVVRYTEGLKK
jgi:mono/diheme cytochrome c family protein